MSESFSSVILAAGEGKRLNMEVPKPLAPAAGLKLIDFPIRELKKFSKNLNLKDNISCVVGHKRELVEEHISQYENVNTVLQEKQIGTGDAVKSYFLGVKDAKDYDFTLITCADTPLIRESHFQKLFSCLKDTKADAVVATFKTTNPTGYGRIVIGDKGLKIIEEKDANTQQKTIKIVNSGLYIFKTSYILDHLDSLNTNNQSGELYLTDLFQQGRNVTSCEFEDDGSFLGVNNPDQLDKVNTILRKERAAQLQNDGVYFVESRHTYLDYDVEIGRGTTVYPNNFIQSGTKIGEKCILLPGSVIKNTIIGKQTTIKPYCILEDSRLGDNVTIGPFAHLRPDSIVKDECKIGNFVEIKKTRLDKGVKVSHLSYVGDAEIGEDSNIGCGFITCNYDGANKHKTTIGKGCFIGSDSQMIAPVKIGDEAYVASGSTINKDIPDGGFAIARERQVTKEGLAKKFLKKK